MMQLGGQLIAAGRFPVSFSCFQSVECGTSLLIKMAGEGVHFDYGFDEFLNRNMVDILPVLGNCCSTTSTIVMPHHYSDFTPLPRSQVC